MKRDDYIEAEDYYEIGCQWVEERDYARAVEAFRHVIELNRKFIYAYVDLAYAFSKMKRYHEAVQVLKKGSRVDPEFHKLNYLMAKYSFRDGNYGGALKNIERAMELSDERLYKLAYHVILGKYKASKS